LRKEAGPSIHFNGEGGRLAKNGVVETTMVSKVGSTEQIEGKSYTRVEGFRDGNLANVDWFAVTPQGLMHARSVDLVGQGQSEFNPPEILLSATLQPGKTWTWRDPTGAVTSKKTVLAPEQVTVPAGSYHVIPVRTEITVLTEGEPAITTLTQWFVPSVGYVKQEMRAEMGDIC
jgi:hypothetical protein